MRHLRLVTLVTLLTFCGCASADYAKYADAQAAFALARSSAEAERYKAMAAIAVAGDTTTRVAAMMAMMGMGANQPGQAPMTAPKSASEEIRQWAAILVPAAASGYLGYQAARVSMNASNNATTTAMSTNDAFVGMAGQIQAPGATTTTSTTTTATDSYSPDSRAYDLSIQQPAAPAAP